MARNKIQIFVILLIIICDAGYILAQKRFDTCAINDMLLIYQGGVQRLDWNEQDFIPCVTHTFSDGHKDWIFDGFLFLEFSDGKGNAYGNGMDKRKAGKEHWIWLLNRIFERGKSLDALDKCIETQKKDLGNPNFKHKIVLSIASPCMQQTDWGELNGSQLDFNIQQDQLKAVKWYIDELMNRFKKAKYKNIELEGLYWLDEDSIHCKNLPALVSKYVHKNKKKFYWIPYFKARGFDKWEELGFDIAYHQPNYFFDKNIPDGRLDDACKVAVEHGMAMEFEFDSRARYEGDDSYYNRMVAYIDAFERNGVYAKSAIAYYAGGRGMIDMWKSTSPRDSVLMDRFAKHIVDRRKIFKIR